MFGWFKRLGSKVVGSVRRLGRKAVAGVRRVGRKVTTSIKQFGHGVGSGLRKGAGKVAKYGSIAAAGLRIGGAQKTEELDASTIESKYRVSRMEESDPDRGNGHSLFFTRGAGA